MSYRVCEASLDLTQQYRCSGVVKGSTIVNSFAINIARMWIFSHNNYITNYISLLYGWIVTVYFIQLHLVTVRQSLVEFHLSVLTLKPLTLLQKIYSPTLSI